jgi:hypothetical protein
MGLTDSIALAGVVVTVVGVIIPLIYYRGRRREAQIREFGEVRAVVRGQQGRLSEAAWNLARETWKSYPVPMLTRAGWILPRPAELSQLVLRWSLSPVTSDRTQVSADQASSMFPSRSGQHLHYSEALESLEQRENHLFNGPIYRPVEVIADRGTLELFFTRGHYFDFLDSTEVLAYEAALFNRKNDGNVMRVGPYRRSLADPFNFWNRSNSLGILTLTIRQAPGFVGFFMHQRKSDYVIVGSELLHVVPAGEFTPSDLNLGSWELDFDIWHTIMREYAEEFLGMKEVIKQRGEALDYENDFPYKQLNEARRSGLIKVHVLGLGLDPLAWKPELLTVCVIEAPIFDLIVAENMEGDGPEGEIISGIGRRGIPFNEEMVNVYAGNLTTRRGACTCLRLAWEHRAALGLETTHTSLRSKALVE